MRTHLKLVTLSVAVGAALSVAYLMGYLPTQIGEPTADIAQATPDEPVLAQTTQPQANGEQTEAQAAANDLDDVDPASIDWAAMRSRAPAGDLYDPMLLRWNQLDYTQEEIAAFNKLAVVPFNPKVGEKCNTETIREGKPGAFVTESCSPVLERVTHPYEQIAIEELIELAEINPEAAVFVSWKADDPKQRFEFAIRATALSAKPGPIMELANRHYSASDRIGSEPEEINAYANEIIGRIVLEKVADVLGDPRANPQAHEKYLSDFAQTPEQVQEFLNLITEETQKVLDEMIEIERETTGSTAVWEKVNA
jgi:hypothetical protein